ncbi:MAG: peptidoglycan recognition family protein [Patescibacteria group bacterium]|nr:peptidoglycan recognition family protein [Patescibacteria group bacterium]
MIYSKSYNSDKSKYLCIHHTGWLGNQNVSTQNLTAKNINAAHQYKWDMISSLGNYGGYNFFIDKDGIITQFRLIGEETIANRNWNFGGVAISVCLAGNFSKGIDTPTSSQISALKTIYAKLIQKNPLIQIIPHRRLNPTECYGLGLPDNYFNRIMFEDYQLTLTLLERLKIYYNELINKIRFGKISGRCEDIAKG